jgi:3-oxoacyl-(acyl-carrier-protein) synthase
MECAMRELQEELLACVANKALSQRSAVRVLRALSRARSVDEPIAVVGMAGRWPGADSIDSLWLRLCEGVPQVRPFPQARYRQMAGWVDGGASAHLSVGAYLDSVNAFDAAFFGIGERDAELMDPVQRQFLEVAWLAFDDAGAPPTALKGRQVGVFVGYCSGSDDLSYWQLVQQHAPQLASLAFTGNLPPMLAGRISHLLDLRGPSLVVDTACSSSLVAVHQACQALRLGECELALAGGVKLHLFPQVATDRIGIESADGITRSFAGGKGGTGIGEGVGAVVLKPLGKAIHDGDAIYAVVAASACNQDGRTAGLTVPNVEAQQAVIEAAWRQAGIGAADVGCVEAHGTGTRLGDPIEFEALARAFRSSGAPDRSCAVGSSKAIFGHLDSAAGITGFIKAALMVRHQALLPAATFTLPNDHIDYLASPLYVNDRLSAWPDGAGRHCGVSAFSMNGTNCHVVLCPVSHDDAPRARASADKAIASARFQHRDHWFADRPSPRRIRAADDARSEVSTPDRDDVLARAWRDALGTGAMGDDVDFFQAGGDSLKAAVMASRLSRELGRHVGVGQLWRTPTFAALRAFLEAAGDSEATGLPTYARRDAYALSPAQKHIYVQSSLSNDVLYNVPFGLRLSGVPDVERLHRRATQLCEADPGLRVRFLSRGGQVVQVPHDGPSLDFVVVDAPDDEALKREMAAFIRPFDLARGPLARMALIHRTGDHHLLLMDFHHLVMDGFSVGVLVQRLAQAYTEADEVAAAALIAPRRNALDYAAWLEERIARREFESHREFWAQRFRERGPGRIDGLRTRLGTAESTKGGRHTLTLQPEPSARIAEFARCSGHGLFATLLGAFALALHAVSGQRSFNVGTPFSGRAHAGMEDILGMFVNLLPMPIDIDRDVGLGDWLAGLRSWLAVCMEHQDNPLDLLADTPSLPRENIDFNVAFALQNMPIASLELGDGLSAEPVAFYELPWNVAKFDLTLFAMEVDDRLVLSFEYRVGAVAASWIGDVAGMVTRALDEVIAARHERISACLHALGASGLPTPPSRKLTLQF